MFSNVTNMAIVMQALAACLILFAIHRTWRLSHNGVALVPWFACEIGLTRRTPDGVAHRGHDPRKHPIGGYKCSFCGEAGANLSDFYTSEAPDITDDYVSQNTRLRWAVKEKS